MLFVAVAIGACAEEPQPRGVSEFVENPIMLEAAMVRCARDREKLRYDQECINARQAVTQIEAKEEAKRRADLEARSQSKRQALRRTQEAASQARRRAADMERQRREAEYLAQFGVALPSADEASDSDGEFGNTPQAVIPADATVTEQPADVGNGTVPATEGGNAPVSSVEPEAAPRDLESIRDELQRRQSKSEN